MALQKKREHTPRGAANQRERIPHPQAPTQAPHGAAVKKTRLLDENLLQILLYPIIDYTGSIILDLI